MYLGMAAPVRLVAEPWTLITSMFLHAPNSLLHILFNMIALYSVGPVLERMIGHWRFLGLYVISGLGGSLGLMVWAAVAPGGIGLADGSLWGFWSLIWPVCIIAGGISPYRRRYPLHVDLDGGELRLAVRGRWRGVAGACRRLCSGWNTHMAAGGWWPAWRGKSLKWRMQVYGWAMVVLVIALILLCNMANPYGWMSFGSLH